jgi:hypothetical protein
MNVISADFATEQTLKAQRRIREETIKAIAELEETDHLLWGALSAVFQRVEEVYLSGRASADFHLDTLFGKGCWNERRSKMTELLRKLGYKVEYSLSSNSYNERMFLSWGPKD